MYKKAWRNYKKREELFESYLKTTGFNAEPVLLTYEDDENFNKLLLTIQEKRPEYEFSTTDKKLHRLWLVNDEIHIGEKLFLFLKKKRLYT